MTKTRLFFFLIFGYTYSCFGQPPCGSLSDPSFNAPTVSGTTITLKWITHNRGAVRYSVGSTSGLSCGVVSTVATLSNSILSCSVTGTLGETYDFTLDASRDCIDGGGSVALESSNPVFIQVTLPPPPPTGLVTTSITINSFNVAWSSANGATSYKLDVSSDDLFTSILPAYNDLTVSATSRLVTGLNAGTTYYCRVRSVNAAGTSASSVVASQITLPGAPVTAPASSITSSSFVVNWGSVAGANNGYKLDVATDNLFTSILPLYNNLTVSGTSRLVTGLSGGTTYHYRIRSANAAGLSVSSEIASQITLPNAPVALDASSVTVNSFVANWSTVSGATGYKLDVSTDNSFPSSLPSYQNLVVNGLSQTVSGLNSGTTYYYRVRAFNEAGSSDNSTPIISKLTLPGVPQNFKSSDATSTTIKVQWDRVSGASEYEIQVFAQPSNNLVSTSTTDLTSKVVGGLNPSTIYILKIKAKNASGFSDVETTTLGTLDLTGKDVFEINITNGPYPKAYLPGSPLELTVSVSGGTRTGPFTTYFFHRKNSETGFVRESTNFVDNAFKVAVSDAWLDDFGMEFYFEAADPTGLIKNNQQSGQPFSLLRGIAKVSIPIMNFGKEIKNYQIISFPYELSESQLETLLIKAMGKAYDKTLWRFVQYQNGINRDFIDGLGQSKVAQGQGYWFISKDPVDLSFGSGNSFGNSLARPFTMSLKKGWNQIGNPFPYNVSWQSVLNDNGNPTSVGKLMVFDPETVSFVEDDKLRVFGGGFIFTESDIDIIFRVTLRANGGRTAIHQVVVGKESPEWILPIRLSQGEVTNTLSGIGMQVGATKGKDLWDRVTAPRFIRYLEFNTHQAGFSYDLSRSIIDPQESYTWTYSIASDAEGPVTLSWDKITAGAIGGQVILHDQTRNILLDMSTADHHIAYPSSVFAIHYNKEKRLEEIPINLGIPYPNPFQTQLTIPFDYCNSTCEPVDALLTVYDLNGAEIANIATSSDEQQNLQVIQWDGQNDKGVAVSAGVYLYRLTITKGIKTVVQRGKIVKL